MATNKKALARAKSLLLTPDEARIEEGIELLHTLGHPALFDALLAQTRWQPAKRAAPVNPAPGVLMPARSASHAKAEFGRLVPGGFVASAQAAGGWRQVLALRLLAAAPPGTRAAALAASITSLQITRRTSDAHRPALDLAPLAAFKGLERLRLYNASGVMNLAALRSLPRLGELSLDLIDGLEDLSPLDGAPSLATLRIRGTGPSKTPVLRDLPALRSLDLSECATNGPLDFVRELRGLEVLLLCPLGELENLEALAKLEALRSLSLLMAPGLSSLTGLERCTKIEHFSLGFTTQLASLAPLRQARGLRTLRLQANKALQSLAGLEGLTTLLRLDIDTDQLRNFDALAASALTEVSLMGTPMLESLAGLRGTSQLEDLLLLQAPSLRSLDGLENCTALRSLSGIVGPALENIHALRGAPKLRGLMLAGASSLSSLAGLEGATHLETLSLEGSGLRDVSALQGKPRLELVNVKGASQLTDVQALVELPRLRALLLAGTSVDRKKLDPRLRRVASFAARAD